MKFNSLQFGKAMSAALFVLLLVVVGSKNVLAQTQVAILQHSGDISVFYGQNAFVEAHNAAETGDVITLSSGTFTPTDITKAITLRGAGCVIDTVTGTYPTVIPNYIQMNVTEETPSLTVEGIYFSGTVSFLELNHPKFIKCNFNNFTYGGYYEEVMQNAQIINCKFSTIYFSQTRNTTLINCVIGGAYSMNQTEITVTAFNSIIKLRNDAYALSAYNCILNNYSWSGYHSGHTEMQQNSVAYNCIGIKSNGQNIFSCQTFNCMVGDSFSEFFQISGFSYDEPSYVLLDEIATSFLGTDGTEVGIHGGTMPYNSRPSYQIVEHYSVPNNSDNEGHLNVGIEIFPEGE